MNKGIFSNLRKEKQSIELMSVLKENELITHLDILKRLKNLKLAKTCREDISSIKSILNHLVNIKWLSIEDNKTINTDLNITINIVVYRVKKTLF